MLNSRSKTEPYVTLLNRIKKGIVASLLQISVFKLKVFNTLLHNNRLSMSQQRGFLHCYMLIRTF